MIEGSMKRIFAGTLVAVVSALGTVAAQAPPPQATPAPSRPVVLQRVLVKVNGAIFTKTELEERQIQTLAERNQRQLSQLDLQNDASLRTMLVEITPEILANVVDELIIIQQGREMGARLSDEQFKSAVDGIKKENQLDDASLVTALKASGMDMADLRAQNAL